MKRYLSLVVLLIICINIFASSFNASLGFKCNGYSKEVHETLMEVKIDDMKYGLIERGGEDITLYFSKEGKGKISFDYGAAFASYNSGASSFFLHSLFCFVYGKDYANLKFSLGVQGVGVKYIVFSHPLYSLSPLLEVIARVNVGKNTFNLGLSCIHPKERVFKASPVLFFLFKRDITPSFSLVFESWGRIAEYFMDPWLAFQSYGNSIGINYRWDA